MRYPMEVYRAGATRVIWSHEEHLAVKADGWMDEKVPHVPLESSAGLAEPTEPKRRTRRMAEES